MAELGVPDAWTTFTLTNWKDILAVCHNCANSRSKYMNI